MTTYEDVQDAERELTSLKAFYRGKSGAEGRCQCFACIAVRNAVEAARKHNGIEQFLLSGEKSYVLNDVPRDELAEYKAFAYQKNLNRLQKCLEVVTRYPCEKNA